MSKENSFSVGKPPFFNGEQYDVWKGKMTIFLRAQDMKVWTSTQCAWIEPTITDTSGPFPVKTMKPIAEWTQDELDSSKFDSRALNSIVCAMSDNEYKRIIACKNAKEAWDTLRTLIRNRKIYSDKSKASVVLAFVAMFNFSLAFLPHVDIFGNIGSFIAGLLLGFMLLYNIQLSILERKKGIFDFCSKRFVRLKQKLDNPRSRIIALILFSIIFGGSLAAMIYGANISEHCVWCRNINCIPVNFGAAMRKRFLVSDLDYYLLES